MTDAAAGWWQKVGQGKSETLHTADAGKTWQNVTPDGVTRAVQQQSPDHLADEFLGSLVDLDPLDGRRLWLAAPLATEKRMLVAYTADGGQHWRQGAAPAPLYYDGVQINFLDEQHGLLLAISDESAGSVHSTLEGTNDAGLHWHQLTVPFTGYSAPTFCLRTPREAWCSGDYAQREEYGVPLFRTRDGGRTWARQKLPLPKAFAAHKAHYYGTPDVPVFTGRHRQHGTLAVDLHQHVDQPYLDAKVEYQSEDGGKTWHLSTEQVQVAPAR